MATERTLTIPGLLSQTPQPVIGPANLGGVRYLLKLYWSDRVGFDAGGWNGVGIH